MNVTETSQVVRSPDEDVSAAIEERVLSLLEQEPPITLRVALKLRFGRMLHIGGIHTWVRHMRYDDASDRLIDVGLVCWFCSRGKRA